MTIDNRRFYELALARMIEAAEYQKEMCGKIENIGKKIGKETTTTEANTSLTYMGQFTQDYLMIPIMREFPHLVPLVEEDTGMKRKYQKNESSDVLIIDPIDGTKLFCEGDPDYSIMTGLIQDGKMTVAIGLYPERKEVYAAIRGKGAWKIDKQSCLERLTLKKADPKRIDCHYRFKNKEPYTELSGRLQEKGYTIGTNFETFGTNLSGVLNIVKGESSAFIAPHIALHDFGVPSLIVEEAGGVMRLFDYKGKEDIQNWKNRDNRLDKLDPQGPLPRYRVIIADNDETVERLLKDMY